MHLWEKIIEILDNNLTTSPEDADVYYNGSVDAFEELISNILADTIINDNITDQDIKWAEEIIKGREQWI